jgi:hypothetical protein
MSIEELEKAVASLEPKEYDSFRVWFADYDMFSMDLDRKPR